MELEKQIGFRLFQRTTRRLSLTESGTRFLDRIEAVLEEIDRAAEEELADQASPSGWLRMTASVAFGHVCLLPLLGEFRGRYPELKVHLELTDANLDLVEHGIDLAVRLAPEVSENLIVSGLMDTHYKLCAAPAYLEEHGRPSAPADLADHRCLRLSLAEFRDEWMFRDASGHMETVGIDGDIIISNPLAIRDAAVAGLGPALLADWLARDALRAGRLVDMFPAHEIAAASFDTAAWLAYPGRAYVPARVRVMIDFLKERFKKRVD